MTAKRLASARQPLSAVTQAAQIRLEGLPAGLRMLVSYLGERLAFKLVDIRPGMYLCVPKTVRQDHPLYVELGAIDYAKLVEVFAGEQLDIPKADKLYMRVRHKRVVELRALGNSVNCVARDSGYTKRHVINILNEALIPDTQGDLFAEAVQETKAAIASQGKPQGTMPANIAGFAKKAGSAHNPFGLGAPDRV